MTHILTGDNDEPIGVIDVDMISDHGTRLAFQMAAHCDDPDELEAIGQQTLARVGTDAFGYICASALRILAEQVLDPALTAGEAVGVHLRDGVLALAEGRDPLTGSTL